MGDCARAKWAEKWREAVVSISVGELGPPSTQCDLHTKWHPDPSNRLARMHQRYRQTGNDIHVSMYWGPRTHGPSGHAHAADAPLALCQTSQLIHYRSVYQLQIIFYMAL